MLSNPKLIEIFKDLGVYASLSNKEIYFVGGCVRDFLYAQKHTQLESFDPRDIDIVVNTNAIKFIENYQDSLEKTGKFFGAQTIKIKESFDAFATVKIEIKGSEDYDIELASTRSEIYPKPAVFPKVKLINDIKSDLPRRDFTVNALLQSLMPDNFGHVVDLVNVQSNRALDDFNNGLIRVFHEHSFIDDPTRIYRAVRFMAKLNFSIEEHTLELLKQASLHMNFQDWFKKRKNRFKIEYDLIKSLPERQSQRAIEFLKELDLLKLEF